MAEKEVPIYEQQCALAGRVAWAALDGRLSHDSDDVVWLDVETARIWASTEVHDSNDLYYYKAGRAALEYFGEDLK